MYLNMELLLFILKFYKVTGEFFSYKEFLNTVFRKYNVFRKYLLNISQKLFVNMFVSIFCSIQQR